jgi:hypothetical protein
MAHQYAHVGDVALERGADFHRICHVFPFLRSKRLLAVFAGLTATTDSNFDFFGRGMELAIGFYDDAHIRCLTNLQTR